MQSGNVYRVRSLSTVHWTGALAAAAGALENLIAPTYVPEAVAAGRHCRSRVREIRIFSKEQIAWEIQLWRKATGVGGSVIDVESFIGAWTFAADGTPGNGSQVTGDTFFYYYINGLDTAYVDDDAAGQFHVRLVNRNAAVGKSAGVAGAIVVELAVEVLQGV